MRETKLFEVRDRMTFMPILAIRVDGDGDRLLRRAGFMSPAVILVPLEGACRHQWSYDPFSWVTLARTLPRAHVHIIDNWANLPDGAVIDVEFISGGDADPEGERGMSCPHLRTELGERFEYCEDCGAVRVRSRPPEAWHSCPRCLLSQWGGRAHGEMITTIAARGEE